LIKQQFFLKSRRTWTPKKPGEEKEGGLLRPETKNLQVKERETSSVGRRVNLCSEKIVSRALSSGLPPSGVGRGKLGFR